VHLRREHADAAEWVSQVTSADASSKEALLSADSRPRCVTGVGRSVLLRLRGLHRRYRPAGERDAPPLATLPVDEEAPPEPDTPPTLEAFEAMALPRPEAPPAAGGGSPAPSASSAEDEQAVAAGALTEFNDLYALTLLIQPTLVLSAAEVSLEAVRHARNLLSRAAAAPARGAAASVFGQGHRSPGAFVAQLVEFLIDDAAQVVAQLQDDLDAFEEGVPGSGSGAASTSGAAPAAVTALGDDAAIAALSEHRRLAVKLRRWVGPQREALKDLVLKGLQPWLFAEDEAARHRLRVALETTSSLAESLDAIREHALVLKDELSALQQSRANHALYVLSMVSALFLPFSFVTGLLSMSIGGIPGQHDERAFYVVTVGCVALLLLGCVLFRRLRWL
jgi:Mg2+ and Co2+ transporter CorA